MAGNTQRMAHSIRVGAKVGAITATGGGLRRRPADLSPNNCADLHLRAALGGLLRTAFLEASA